MRHAQVVEHETGAEAEFAHHRGDGLRGFLEGLENADREATQASDVFRAEASTDGLTIKDTHVTAMLSKLEDGTLDFEALIRGEFGELTTEPNSRSARPIEGDKTISILMSTGGAGYGDPLDRDPESVHKDMIAGLCSAWSAREIYKVAWDPVRERVDIAATEALRTDARCARLARGVPYAAFEPEWLKRSPPADALNLYGSWPDAKPLAPVFRP